MRAHPHARAHTGTHKSYIFQYYKGIPRRFVRKRHSAAHASRGLERSELKVVAPPASTTELKVEPAVAAAAAAAAGARWLWRLQL